MITPRLDEARIGKSYQNPERELDGDIGQQLRILTKRTKPTHGDLKENKPGIKNLTVFLP